MNFLISTLLAGMVSQASAHCKFTGAFGDVNQNIYGAGMLVDPAVPLNGGYQVPFQQDVTVFSDPIVPGWPNNPWGIKPREWMAQGCGATISTVALWYHLNDPVNPKTFNNDQKNWYWYQMKIPQSPVAFVQTEWEALQAAKKGKVPQCSPGGWLRINVHQVNEDGAGPFRCRIDPTGTGTKFGNLIDIPSTQNVYPPDWKQYSFWPAGSLHLHPLTVPIPKDLECKAKFGNADNVCIMRCENWAINGPFGGCIPFQLVGGKPKPVQPQYNYDKFTPNKVLHPPVYANPGYNINQAVNKEYKKRDFDEKVVDEESRKRDLDKKAARRRAIADVTLKNPAVE